MSARGPGEAPPVVRRRRARTQRKPPPATEALKNRAYGSRPARPTPKPKPARVAQPPRGTTPAPVRVVQAASRAQRPTVARPATATQVRSARAQRAQHVSQGKAVAKAAEQQQRVARVKAIAALPSRGGGGGNFDASLAPDLNRPAADRAAEVVSKQIGHKIYLGDDKHYYAHVKRAGLPDRHIPVDPFTGKVDKRWQSDPRSGKVEEAAIQTPAVKVLEQTTRPIHAIAAGEVAAIKREGPVKGLFGVRSPGSATAKAQKHAVSRGWHLKDKSLGSDVLKAAGVKNKGVAAAGGFALDVIQDPLSYTTGGTGSIAEKAAAKAGRRIEKKAVRAGATPEGAQNLKTAASRRAGAAAPPGRGVTVKVAGFEVPGVRRATGATARGARTVTRTVVGPKRAARIGNATRTVTRTFAPRMKAVGSTHAQTFAGRGAAREARALRSQVATKADVIERELGRNLRPGEGPALIDAWERRDLDQFIAPTKAGRDKLAKESPKEYSRKQRAVSVAREAFKTQEGLHARRVVAGAAPRQATREFVTPADLKKLDRTVVSEQAQQRRSVVRAARDATRAGGEGLVRAQQALRAELVKPAAERRGVAGLQARVQAAGRAAEEGGRAVVKPATEVPPAIAGRAGTRAGRRTDDLHAAQQRHAAAHNIPVRSMQETPEAYLRRVHQHAAKHNLPLVKRRAETLLAKRPTETTKAYFPRETQANLEGRLRQTSLLDKITKPTPQKATVGGQARTVGKSRSGFKRIDQRPLRTVNPERVARGDEPFSTDAPLAIANHLREAAKATSEGEFAQNIASAIGRPVRRTEDVREGESLYRLGFEGGQFGLHQAPKVAGKPTRGGQYVAMPDNFVENMQASLRGTSTLSNDAVVAMFDRVQGGWKRLAIANLAFHIRNMLGDIQAGYYLPGLGGSLGKIPTGIQATRRASEMGRYVRAPTRAEQGRWAKAVRRPNEKATVKVGGRDMDLDKFVKLGLDNGVLDTGVVAREVLGHGGLEAEQTAARRARTRVGRGRQAAGRTIDRWVTNRENVMRLAAFKTGLDRGMNPREAADMANFFHIDYGELSGFEREIVRRVMPFYTWTARSLPVAGVTMIQRPGKFANLEALREETGVGSTGQTVDQIEQRMPPAIKRNVPVVLRVGGGDYAVGASLPVTLLNEFPTSTDVGAYLDELAHFGFGLVGPLGGVKPAAELYLNKSFFNRADIQNSQKAGGYVAAPAWLGKAPEWFKHAVKATQIIDKASGKKVWAWPGRIEYASHQLPGAFQQASTAAAGARPGQEPLPGPVAIASPLVGVRVDKLGKVAANRAAQGRMRDELAKLDERASLLNAQGVNRDNPTPEYVKLRARINEISKVLYPRKKKGRGGLDIGLGSGAGAGPDIGLGSGAGAGPDIGLGG